MLKFSFGDLVPGEAPTAADAAPLPEISEEEAPKPPGEFILRLDADDFEQPGIIPNPEFSPDDEDLREWPAVCGRCSVGFLTKPVILKGKAGGRPNFCPDCDRYFGEEKQKLCPLRHPHLPWRQWFRPNLPKTEENFCGWSLTGARQHPIRKPVNPPDSPDMQIQPTGPIGHAKHGPSSLKHKEACPHWVSSGGTNPVAEEGTMLHERLVTGDLSGLDEEQTTIVTMVAGLFKAHEQQLGAGVEVLTERRVNVANLTWGTSDLMLLHKPSKRAKILDAKFGRIAVDDASENLQGVAYAVGVFFEFPWVETVEVIFAQPRLDEVSSHTFTRAADYQRMVNRIAGVIRSAEDPNSPFHPSHENCQYCGFKAKCPALLNTAKEVALRINSEFTIPAELMPENITDPVMMGQAMVVAEALGDWIDGVKARTKELLIQGEQIPLYELARRKAPRTITEPALAWNAVKDVVSPEDFIGAVKSVSVPDLEKAFAANAPRGEKAQAKQALEDRLLDASCLKQDGEILFPKRIKTKTTQNLLAD